MLQLHNSKVDKILKSFKEGFEQRKRAKEEGATLDDRSSNSRDELVFDEPGKPPKVKVLKKKVFKKPVKKEVEFVIKMKGKDGNVVSYDEKESQDSSRSEKENIDEEKPKKKATKKKSLKSKSSSSKIDSEDTLEMLKSVLKSKGSKKLTK